MVRRQTARLPPDTPAALSRGQGPADVRTDTAGLSVVSGTRRQPAAERGPSLRQSPLSGIGDRRQSPRPGIGDRRQSPRSEIGDRRQSPRSGIGDRRQSPLQCYIFGNLRRKITPNRKHIFMLGKVRSGFHIFRLGQHIFFFNIARHIIGYRHFLKPIKLISAISG